MIYGLYLSATGVVTNAHQQDVIANNLANSETTGFKRSMALFEQRRVESQVVRAAGGKPNMLDDIGGGQFLAPTFVDFTQGPLEQSANQFDTAISGRGFIAVGDGSGETRLTRAGEMMIDREGNLLTAQGHKVLDSNRTAINLKGYAQHELALNNKGQISHGRDVLATIGLFDSSDTAALRPVGENLLALTGDARLVPAKGEFLSGFVERSNVDPANELTKLMETQRLLEGNANMIKYQDATLAKLVNEVGKIG
ncbi:MAG: flagellar hook-basal body protein [Burkholderiales bacterium]|nr:flagellar hook-basal body protein [Phycisphaerae bacterium]